MKKVKLVDVARHAGVSSSTVSQFMNGRYKHMSEATKERIKTSVKQLNYVPNSVARSMKTNKTYTIGVIVFSIDGTFTARAVRGIDDYCKKHDYNMLVYNTDYDVFIENKSIDMLKMLQVDGIIIASTGQNNERLYQEDMNGLPIVQMFMSYEGLDISTVIPDYENAAEEAVEYLIGLGHTNIVVITQKYEHVS